MIRYVSKRLVLAVPTVWGVTLVVFMLIHLVPGDPAVALLGPRATPGLVAKLHRQWGLDASLPDQYGRFLRRLFHGDLGQSFYYHAPVTSVIGDRIGVTLYLLLFATVLTVLITVPLATLAALRRGGPTDHAIRGLPVVAMAMPSFWVGIMLVLLLSLKIPIFPAGGYSGDAVRRFESLVLPALTIAMAIAPMTIRSLRSSMIDVLDADYIATAVSKGVRLPALVGRHALRNSLIPVLTVLSVNIGWLVGGTVVVEQVFALPGLGQLMLSAISNRDFALVQGVTLVFAVLVILVYLVTDVAYRLIDPRVSVT